MVTYVVIAIAGFLGANLRFVLSQTIGMHQGFPTATLVINVVGCLFLAWFYTAATSWQVTSLLRTAIGTGFTGAFTTFSTFTVELWKLIHADLFQIACLYGILSLAGCLGATWFGVQLGRSVVPQDRWRRRLRL